MAAKTSVRPGRGEPWARWIRRRWIPATPGRISPSRAWVATPVAAGTAPTPLGWVEGPRRERRATLVSAEAERRASEGQRGQVAAQQAATQARPERRADAEERRA